MVDKKCHCGCDLFKFNIVVSDIEPLINNICSNCGHKLTEHISITRSKQAE